MGTNWGRGDKGEMYTLENMRTSRKSCSFKKKQYIKKNSTFFYLKKKFTEIYKEYLHTIMIDTKCINRGLKAHVYLICIFNTKSKIN